MPIALVCSGCGRTYLVPPSTLKYHNNIHHCSMACRKADTTHRYGGPPSKPKTILSCRTCGATMMVTELEATGGRKSYCSAKCRDLGRVRWGARVQPRIPRITVTCQACGETYTVRATEDRKYCSHPCALAHQKGKERTTYVEQQCQQCGKMFRITRTVAEDGRRFCSLQCKHLWLCKPMLSLTCPVCDATFERKSWRKGVFCSKSCAASARLRNNPSGLERHFATLLDSEGIQYVPQVSVGRWVIDFALSNHRIAIETDGDYWHSSQEAQERDQRKDQALRSKGWTVIRLREHVIHESPQYCVEQIQRAISSAATSLPAR